MMRLARLGLVQAPRARLELGACLVEPPLRVAQVVLSSGHSVIVGSIQRLDRGGGRLQLCIAPRRQRGFQRSFGCHLLVHRPWWLASHFDDLPRPGNCGGLE